MAIIEIPVPVVIVALVFCIFTFWIRWQENLILWTPLFFLPPLLLMTFIYVSSIAGWLGLDVPNTRALWLRWSFVSLIVAIAGNNLVVARISRKTRRVLDEGKLKSITGKLYHGRSK